LIPRRPGPADGPPDEPDGVPFDPYERAADRAADRAATEHAGAPAGAEPPDALNAKVPRNLVRKVLLGLVFLSFLLALASSRRPQPPAVDPSCERASFALSLTTVDQNKPVAFTIVGPPGREYALGLDVSTFERTAAGGWRAVPKPGFAETFLTPAGPERMPEGCTRRGIFATPVPVGKHAVTLYELTDRGAVFVQQLDLEVVEP
jgi:hypothetical protein